MSTDQVRVTDPAAMTDASSTMLAVNVFQRLMSADPGESAPKPDAARDCIFTTATTYECTLNEDEFFHNGHPLTSTDVKFSIERAARLAVPGSSASLLSSLRSIETPDPLTVRFLLSRVDTQFVWALASPAASIVDEESYDPDKVQAPDKPIVGSGPFSVTSYAKDEIALQRYPAYVGRSRPSLDALVYRSVPDSATIEDAMNKGTTDVVWRGLDDAAVTRLSSQAAADGDGNTANGFHQSVLTGLRVLQLEWSPSSPSRANKGLRQAIALALQGDRTSDSVVPGGVPGHVATFPQGGKAKPKVTWKRRITLTLGYDSTEPNGLDVATQIRTRLEDSGGLSVRLRPDEAGDLTVVDRKAWTATALAWLQPYLEAPLAASAKSVAATESEFRRATDDTTGDRLLAALQKQAASDLVVLPLTQSDEYVYARTGVRLAATSFGPGWQLGLFGISRG
jgi:peptide/nickel transport system substrate-binding protein